MLIVMTQDRRFAAWARDPRSKSKAWGELVVLEGPSQQAASEELATALGKVNKREPVCLFAHGNDDSMGDEDSGPDDWGWSAYEVATHLGENLPGKCGPVLIQACATQTVGLSANIADELEEIREWLEGVWFYGYDKAVPITQTLPDPGRLDRNVELKPRCVSWA